MFAGDGGRRVEIQGYLRRRVDDGTCRGQRSVGYGGGVAGGGGKDHVRVFDDMNHVDDRGGKGGK